MSIEEAFLVDWLSHVGPFLVTLTQRFAPDIPLSQRFSAGHLAVGPQKPKLGVVPSARVATPLTKMGPQKGAYLKEVPVKMMVCWVLCQSVAEESGTLFAG